MKQKLTLATRGSKLSLAQTAFVEEKLHTLGIETEILIVKSRGDRDSSRSIAEIGGDGLFVRELERAVLEGDADAAVHSAKDLPSELSPGLSILSVPVAGDARDCLVTRRSTTHPKTIGTGSLRRQVSYRAIDPAAEFLALRGNVTTRLARLSEGVCDGLLLAKAGLDRLALDLSEFEVKVFESNELLPAVGQGLLAVEGKAADEALFTLLSKINDEVAEQRLTIERTVFRKFGARCTDAVAVYAKRQGEIWNVTARLGEKIEAVSGGFSERERLAEQLAEKLL